MTFFKDLTTFEYFQDARRPELQQALNVGWLSALKYYPLGLTSHAFRHKLRDLCAKPQLQTRGYHPCYLGLCKLIPRSLCAVGSGIVIVRGAKDFFAAPELIYHYVRWHWYRPPRAFIDAVLATMPTGSLRSRFSISRLTSA